MCCPFITSLEINKCIALDSTGVPYKVDIVLQAAALPGHVRSDGDGSEVERSEASSDLLEAGAVTSVPSEEESMFWTQN